MERRYDASIAGAEPVYQPPDKHWALSRQAQWLGDAASRGPAAGDMPPITRQPTLKERVALRREIVQAMEMASGPEALDRWVWIFEQAEPLLGLPTVDIQSDSPGGRSGSWIHEILNRAAAHPVPHKMALVAGLVAHWVSKDDMTPDRAAAWSLLVPPLPAMETWRPELLDRFDFKLIDSARRMMEESLAPDQKAKARKAGRMRKTSSFADPGRQPENRAMAARALASLLATASALDQIAHPRASSPPDRYLSHCLVHLRWQAAAVLSGAQIPDDAPHPLHAPSAFRYQPDNRAEVVGSSWKTGACSIIDCLEHSRLIRAHILTAPGAFDQWRTTLRAAVEALPPDQSALPANRLQALTLNPQVKLRPDLVADITQALMLGATPQAAPTPNPSPAPRF